MRGHTLLELLLVLTLLSVAVASLARSAGQHRDRASVVAAREAVVGLLAEARRDAVEEGLASVRLSVDPAVAVRTVADSTVEAVALGGEFGVEMKLSGGQGAAELPFNALGLGRVASQTVAFRRGRATAELVVSSFGRVRRR